ncbi:MAG: PepSY domain-containing protein [Lachnospiraceae bacterium]|nr:PepSY domain-containing protein [Lachnospiraceae bacterium]
MQKRKISLVILAVSALLLAFAVWGPERLARYKDKKTLNHVTVETVDDAGAGYRYSLSNNEKLYILSKCLDNQVLPGNEMSAMTRQTDVDYGELNGTYAFVINRGDSLEKKISEEEVLEICNQGLEELKGLGIVPETVKELQAADYNAVLYSGIDVLEPRNNLAVWKVSLSTSKQNADKSNRLLDVYIDADTGKIYEFYVRTPKVWEDILPDEMIEKWSTYMGLTDWEHYEDANPLLETTPYFRKYKFPGMDEGSTVVTVGFYEGINELFLKISN